MTVCTRLKTYHRKAQGTFLTRPSTLEARLATSSSSGLFEVSFSLSSDDFSSDDDDEVNFPNKYQTHKIGASYQLWHKQQIVNEFRIELLHLLLLQPLKFPICLLFHPYMDNRKVECGPKYFLLTILR